MMVWGILHMNNLDFIMPVFLDNYSVEQSLALILAWAFMAALCIVIGYAFVGAASLIERTMSGEDCSSKKRIREEAEPRACAFYRLASPKLNQGPGMSEEI